MIDTLADALAKQGYDTLTPVQEAVTDPALQDEDLLVSAQTGSGKTVGFGLAIAPTLLGDSSQFGAAGAPLALVIAPTRELAMQVQRELTWLYGQAGAVIMSTVGGMDARSERRALDRGAHVVVATPGRLCDHIKRGNIDLSAIRAIVLDEADEMLDLGFREELEFILSEAPADRRTLMFSATVPKAIAKLAESYQRDARRVEVMGEARQHADIEYRALNVHPRDTENAIINVLRYYEAKNAIVFCNTRAAVARLAAKLTNRSFSVVALSGELTQSERSNALQALRDGRARVCVATDVAARGIDLPNLDLVIHADLPSNSDTLLHRSGRTGRAGRKGVSALIVPPKVRTKAHRLTGWAKLQVEWADPPSAAEVLEKDEERLLADPAWRDPVPEDAVDTVATLVAEFSPEQLATAFVNLARAKRSAPEELTDPAAADDRPRKTFGPSVWFRLSQGRTDGAEPRTLLPMLCRVGDMTRDDIGAIRVQPRHSYVEVLASRADALAAQAGEEITVEGGMTLTRLDSAPDLERAASQPRTSDSKQGKPHKPAAAPKGKRPPKSHKTERSPMKPGAKPKPKRDARDQETVTPGKKASAPSEKKPRAKAVWTKDRQAVAKREVAATRESHSEPPKPRGKGKPTGPAKAGKAGGKPAGGKGSDAAKKRAADTSKRFVPPNKRGKPSTGKGPNAKPKRPR